MNKEAQSSRYSDEARRIYQVLFSRECPEILISRYVKAVEKLNERLGEEDIRAHQSIMDRVRDIEALEMAARYRGLLSPLTDKFRIMVFLAETLPENYNNFIAQRTGRIFGWMVLLGVGVRSMWKLMKGLWLLSGSSGVAKNA